MGRKRFQYSLGSMIAGKTMLTVFLSVPGAYGVLLCLLLPVLIALVILLPIIIVQITLLAILRRLLPNPSSTSDNFA